MFNAIAKFFARRTTQEVSNNQVTDLSAQEETADANAPFFKPTNIAADYAMKLDERSHYHYYGLLTDRLSRTERNLYNFKRPANHFIVSFNVADMPPKSVLAQLILDGFQLEYHDHQVHITLPISQIELEADQHLVNFMSQMKAAQAAEEEAERKRLEDQETETAEDDAKTETIPADIVEQNPEDEELELHDNRKGTTTVNNQPEGTPVPDDLQLKLDVYNVVEAFAPLN